MLKARLQSHLAEIARDRDCYLATAGHFYVQNYIQSQLAQWGTVEIYAFTRQGQRIQHLILNLPGQRADLPPILVGAHYDAVPGSPGADDNATGVAALLEIARALSEQPALYPVRLVAFDLEETVYELAGSVHYARSLQQSPLRLMLSLEMLGYCTTAPKSQQYPLGFLKHFYPNEGNFIGLIGNVKAVRDLIHLCHWINKAGVPCRWLPVPGRGLLLPDTRRSDHAAFWDRGDRALMVTDTAFLRNPHYHRASDRLETLDLNFLTGVCQGLIDGVRWLR